MRFAIDRAGLVGADGATHAGSFDVTYLCTLPNFVVMAAADEAELAHMTKTAAPTAIASQLICQRISAIEPRTTQMSQAAAKVLAR